MSLAKLWRTAGRESGQPSIAVSEDRVQQATRLIDEGNALEDAGDVSQALSRYEEAVRLAPESARTHLNRGNALLALGNLNAAIDSFQAARARDPRHAGAHYNLGNAYARASRHAEASAAYQSAIDLDPDFADAHFALGCALDELGRRSESIACYRRALEINPDYAEVCATLGDALVAAGELDAGAETYSRALTIRPAWPWMLCRLGDVLRALGRLNDAAASYRRAVQLDPVLEPAHIALGNALAQMAQYADAATSYGRALEIDPNNALALCNLGNVLNSMRQPERAVASYRRALAIKPDFAEAHNNLGNVLFASGQLHDALAGYRRAVDVKPDFADAHYNLANTLQRLGLPDDAIVAFRRAIDLQPAFAEAHGNLGNALKDVGRLDEAAASYRRALAIKPDFALANSNLLFCASHDETIDPPSLLAEHLGFAARFEAPQRGRWPAHRNVRDPQRTVRVGFVSADLRDHPVAYFIEPVLEHLAKRAHFELFAYYNHRGQDHVTQRLRRRFGLWQDVHELSDADLAQTIAGDGIDILIDLSGHTAENRLLTFARKPAPVQASWIGYPGTTGLSAIDYYFADRFFLPSGPFDHQFVEKLVHLPASVPFLPFENAPAVNVLPAVENGWMTFRSFNRLSKLRPCAVSMWVRVLRALPDARLLIGAMPRTGQYQWLVDFFADRHIASERISYYERCSMPAYLALHHKVDLCLDAYPYTGGTTTNHALWMGVPTLTCAGSTPASRQGAAMLGQVGLEQFVAKDVEGFESIAVRWASDRGSLAELRSQLRVRCERSAIRQPHVVAAGVEYALGVMWQRWCAGLAPQPIDATAPDLRAPDPEQMSGHP